MIGSPWRPMDTTSRIVTGILVVGALAFAAFEYRFDPDVLSRSAGLDQAKVDPRPAISSTINRVLGTESTPVSSSK